MSLFGRWLPRGPVRACAHRGGAVKGLAIRAWPVAVVLACLVLRPAPGYSQQPGPSVPPAAPSQPAPPPPVVQRIAVSGNVRIPSEKILAAVTETKVGEPVSDEKLLADVRAINDLGGFTAVAGRLEPEPGGGGVGC